MKSDVPVGPVHPFCSMSTRITSAAAHAYIVVQRTTVSGQQNVVFRIRVQHSY